MKTAIVFATKYGATAEIAELLRQEMGPEDICLFDLAAGVPDLADYPYVVVGTSIYAGKALKPMKDFLRSGALKDKIIGLFVSGMELNHANRDREIMEAFPQEMRKRAKAIAFLGGKFQPDKMTAYEQFVFKKVLKILEVTEDIHYESIRRFAKAMKA